MENLQNLDGRVAVVTGGAGHLGRAMGRALAELGATVCLVDRNETHLSQAADDCKIDPAGCFACDLGEEASRIAMAEEAISHHGRIDILINNAAFVGDSNLDGWATPFPSQTLETWRAALEVNLTSPFHLTQLFLSQLTSSGNGTIINIGSIYGMLGPDWSLYEGTPMANPAAYAASKGGLIQLTRWLATTLGPEVRVNTISPGGIERNQPTTFSERYVKRTPLGRMGKEEDFTGMVGYLASDASAWVTGQNFVIDGGWSAW